MRMKLNVLQDAIDEMTEHAEETYPNECVGFLFGTEEKERNILVIREVKNAKKGDQRRRFEVDPYDYLHAEKFAEKNGLLLLGLYHSHPDHPAIPSEHDLKQAVPYFSYIILSVQQGTAKDIRSWQLNMDTNQFEEEKVFNKQLDQA